MKATDFKEIRDISLHAKYLKGKNQKNSLKVLTEQFLNQIIQEETDLHSPVRIVNSFLLMFTYLR